ncbi:MAG: ATP-dependent sacrificial sulfur transferase LarE [bacterium]
MNTVEKKYNELQKILRSLHSAVIAFSGGVDSTFLLWVAKKIFKENITAVTFKSEIIPQSEIEDAKSLTVEFGVKHIIIDSDILDHKPFISNDKERCYYCKKFIFSGLSKIAESHNLKYIIEGSNADDVHDYRPGRKVLLEMNIQSPLAQAGLTKKEIRKLSRKIGLSTWNKPALACLATRIPYGIPITVNKISRINKCEQFLLELGFKQVRVRDHDSIARIEIPNPDLPELLKIKNSSAVVKKFKDQGFNYICADLEGYRSGSMNEVIKNGQ